MSNVQDNTQGGNVPHRHRILNPSKAKTYQGVSGQIAITLDECGSGSNLSAFNGVHCGPVGVTPLFKPNTDFSCLYDLVDNGCEVEGVEGPVGPEGPEGPEGPAGPEYVFPEGKIDEVWTYTASGLAWAPIPSSPATTICDYKATIPGDFKVGDMYMGYCAQGEAYQVNMFDMLDYLSIEFPDLWGGGAAPVQTFEAPTGFRYKGLVDSTNHLQGGVITVNNDESNYNVVEWYGIWKVKDSKNVWHESGANGSSLAPVPSATVLSTGPIRNVEFFGVIVIEQISSGDVRKVTYDGLILPTLQYEIV